MKTCQLAVSLLIVLLFVGCIPLTQIEPKPTSLPYHLNQERGERYALLSIGNPNQKKAYAILPKESFAIDPAGKKLPIDAEAHPYDLDKSHAFIRDRIYLPDYRQCFGTYPWRDGNWTLHLKLKSSPGNKTQTVIIPFRLWTFYYFPLIHGAPN